MPATATLPKPVPKPTATAKEIPAIVSKTEPDRPMILEISCLEHLADVIGKLNRGEPRGAELHFIEQSGLADAAELEVARNFILDMPKSLPESVAKLKALLIENGREAKVVDKLLEKLALDPAKMNKLDVTKSHTIDLRAGDPKTAPNPLALPTDLTKSTPLSRQFTQLLADCEARKTDSKPLVYVRLPIPADGEVGKQFVKDLGTWCHGILTANSALSANFEFLRATHSEMDLGAATYKPPVYDVAQLIAMAGLPPIDNSNSGLNVGAGASTKGTSRFAPITVSVNNPDTTPPNTSPHPTNTLVEASALVAKLTEAQSIPAVSSAIDDELLRNLLDADLKVVARAAADAYLRASAIDQTIPGKRTPAAGAQPAALGDELRDDTVKLIRKLMAEGFGADVETALLQGDTLAPGHKVVLAIGLQDLTEAALKTIPVELTMKKADAGPGTYMALMAMTGNDPFLVVEPTVLAEINHSRQRLYTPLVLVVNASGAKGKGSAALLEDTVTPTTATP